MAVRYGRKLVINVYLDDETFEALDLLAKGWATPRSRIVEQLIQDFISLPEIRHQIEHYRRALRGVRDHDGQKED
jgi:predicted transcriptional regulator